VLTTVIASSYDKCEGGGRDLQRAVRSPVRTARWTAIKSRERGPDAASSAVNAPHRQD
jgi:hypothetical protein